ncbi:YafY family transcriptional regulator [Sphingobacterium olei]|uniref:YafY family transcriptional regulator n=1 Tax=Sphingobacterium olei TaxID=2571155 RepID=A0A4U0NTU1_9SPHI|nr:YafY family protein [Sphingobacterium olei]TJZ53664.1 YafY family transcriptional regulator [Sphingobacterium olei]
MSKDLKKRFDRIVEILIQLQSKRIVKAKELSARFEVSLRTIYRDIKSLEQAGVPIIGEAGAGYSLVEGYKLPPVIFTKEEAMSFVAAEKLTQKFLDKSISDHFTTAMYKVKAVLKINDKDIVAAIENQIVMNKSNYDIFNHEVPHAFTTFFESIANRIQIKLCYRGVSDDLPQTRIIEPIGLFHESGFWYIAAYCLNREAYRQFRADRIHAIALTSISYSKEHISIGDFLAGRTENIQRTHVRVAVDKDIAMHLQWERSFYGFISQEEKTTHVEMTFETRSIDEFARWYMMFADKAVILEPDILKQSVRTLINKSLKKINS